MGKLDKVKVVDNPDIMYDVMELFGLNDEDLIEINRSKFQRKTPPA